MVVVWWELTECEGAAWRVEVADEEVDLVGFQLVDDFGEQGVAMKLEAGREIGDEELEIPLWGVPFDKVSCDGFLGKGFDMGDGVLGEEEEWASSEGVEAFEVVEFVGGFGEGEEVGVNGLDFPGLVFGPHGIPPDVPVDDGEGVRWRLRFLLDEIVFDEGDKEDGKNGESQVEAGPLELLSLSGECSGKNEDSCNEWTGKEEEHSCDPVAVPEDLTDEPRDEENEYKVWGDSEELGQHGGCHPFGGLESPLSHGGGSLEYQALADNYLWWFVFIVA